MGQVLQFPGRIDAYKHGEAYCIHCGHEWISISPINTQRLQCPQCLSMRGIFRAENVPVTAIDRWTCDCTNELFYLTPNGPVCSSCGLIITKEPE